MRRLQTYIAICVVLLLTGCMKWEYGTEESFEASGEGLFICNEGNFQYGNATLSYYNPATRHVENEVFYRANAMKLGDVAQSMTIHNNIGWVVVNNSHVVFEIDLDTFREKGRITGFTSPRYMLFISDEKAYVSQIWDNRIFIVNPKTYQITGSITCPNMTMEQGSTEQMVRLGDYVYVNCWSYQNRILKIDTRSDEVVGEVEVGIQPTSLVADYKGRLWSITDGGYSGSPYGYEAAKLYCIDPATMTILGEWRFRMGDSPSEIQLNGRGDTLYWLNDDVWAMSVDSQTLPVRPKIESRGTIYYGLTIDPRTEDIYIADAIDYQQQGKIYRYSAAGELIDEFYVGIIPGAFCWK